MPNLVLTIAIGVEYQALAQLTHPTIRAYAARIGADFHCITTPKIAVTSPHWAKFEIAELLNIYERILYLDTDLIVRDDCPDLFEIVPVARLGAFNEAPFVERSRELLIDVCRAYGVTLDTWDTRYFNSGVLVISRGHQVVFIKPAHEECNYYEQTYFNVNIALLGVPMFELPYSYNRMTCLDTFTGESRLSSFIVHYAGAPNIQMLLPIIRSDLATWHATRPAYKFVRHIHVIVSGGLGDQCSAEPAIRFMRKYVYPSPEAHITVTTHFPWLFQHLDVDVFSHGAFHPTFDTPYFTVQSLPPPESIQWMVLSNLLCHTVDYCAAALLRRILPVAEKRIHVPVHTHGDIQSLSAKLGGTDISGSIVVHAGRHWNTKSFPLPWWQGVVDALAVHGFHIILIGQDEETRGVIPVVCPTTGLDVRNQLSLPEVSILLASAPVLLSNDSAPIHLAGAYDNGIILVPSCKHPEHVLPWRHGQVYWNAEACYTRLTIDDVNAQPTAVHGSSAEFEVVDWGRYLPSIATVVAGVVRRWQWTTHHAPQREETAHAYQ